jgi:hypothetical protein
MAAMGCNGDGVEMFKAFMCDRVALSHNWQLVQDHITKHGLAAGAEPPSLDTWTAARLATYGARGILDRTEWLAEAKAFRTWQAGATKEGGAGLCA